MLTWSLTKISILLDSSMYNIFNDIQMVASGKGGTCLLLNDYKFNLHNKNNDGVSYYRCMKHKLEKLDLTTLLI